MGTQRIRGITIELDGNATKLNKALKDVQQQVTKTASSLKDVNKLLKLDPGNTDLLTQKQKLLKESIGATKEKLDQLKDAQKNALTTADYDAIQREIVETEKSLESLEEEYKNFGSVSAQQIAVAGEKIKDVGGKITEVGKGLTQKVTVPLVAVGTLGAAKFAEVDKTMQLTNQTMGNTKEQAELLNKAMKDAAANSTFGMSDAATAALNFARAGLDAEQAASTLAPAMNLAAGEGGNLDTVSAGLVATINGFHGSFEEAGQYADVFAAACNNSALDVDSLSNAMSIAAPIFSSAGYSVNDAALYMGVMANNGIQANKAATSLKTGLARLAKPSKDAQVAMDDLGISLTDANGQMKDSKTLQKELYNAFKGLTEAEKLAAAGAIFGKNQMAPWLALINTAPEDVAKLDQSLATCTGTTEKMADAMMSGFGGSLEKLKSSIDVAVTSLGEALAPTIQKVADFIQKLVDAFNSLSPAQQQMIVKIGLVVAAIGPLLVGLGTLLSTIGSIMTWAPIIVGAIGSVVAAAGPVIAIIAAVVAVGVLLYKNWDTICAWAKKLGKTIKNAWNDIKKRTAQAWDNIKTRVTAAFNAIKTTATTVMNNVKSGIQNAWNGIKTAVTDRVNAIKNGVSAAFNNIKSLATTVFNGVKDTASKVFSKVLDIITSPFKNAVSVIKNAVQTIKNAFKFRLSIPKIKLPHINVKWKSVGNFFRIPKLSVRWYKKAYENAVMFNQPTVMQTPYGAKGFGDGNGSEVVLGMNKLRELVGGSGDMNTTINIYAQPNQNVNQLADEVSRRMTKLLRQKGAAFA